jgi:hypothetical protein
MKIVPFHEMEVTKSILQESGGLKQYGLQKSGKIYLVFLEGFVEESLVPEVPESDYKLTWLNVDTGEMKESTERLTGSSKIESPFEEEQVVLLMQTTK